MFIVGLCRVLVEVIGILKGKENSILIPDELTGDEAVMAVAEALNGGAEPPLSLVNAAETMIRAYVKYVNRELEYRGLLAQDDPALHVSGYGE